MHKVFISYYHFDDQEYKNQLVNWGEKNNVFLDVSVDTGNITENLQDESIRQIIRDDYISESTVTIVLVGNNTQKRKHVDWEISATMYNSNKNPKGGIIVLYLPTIGISNDAASSIRKELQPIIEEIDGAIHWVHSSKGDILNKYKNLLPKRIEDQINRSDVSVPIMSFESFIKSASIATKILDDVFENRGNQDYDTSENLRRHNGN